MVASNVDAGFSIVSYTGNGTNGATVGHGLSQAPDVVLIKNRSTAYNWRVGFNSSIMTNDLILNSTAAGTAYADGRIGDMYASSFELGGTGSYEATNTSGDNYIAYCFHSVDGYSKFGSYTGNGSTDGSFVYTGFRPAFVIRKRTDSAGSWRIHDSERNTYNVTNYNLVAEDSQAEVSVGNEFDILSNGFKCRATNGDTNASGGTYIYMAFAEYPFSVGGGIAR